MFLVGARSSGLSVERMCVAFGGNIDFTVEDL